MKLQWQAVDARPIKKLAEAKARKKKKKDKAYEKLIQRANAALNAEEGEQTTCPRRQLRRLPVLPVCVSHAKPGLFRCCHPK